LALVAAGFAAVLARRRCEMLEETAALAGPVPDDAAGAPPRVLLVPTDIGDPSQIVKLFEQVATTYGGIDLLFNNAGISTRGVPFEQWSNVVAVNLGGSFLCTQHAFRMMNLGTGVEFPRRQPAARDASDEAARRRFV
jgi:NAD(P)-dependent dehydrogenase (short-subunit alcohol dehydrogenase family)